MRVFYIVNRFYSPLRCCPRVSPAQGAVTRAAMVSRPSGPLPDGNPPPGRVLPGAVGPLRRWVSPLWNLGHPNRPPPVGAASPHRSYHPPDVLLFTRWPKHSVQHDGRITEIRKDFNVNLLWFRRQFVYYSNDRNSLIPRIYIAWVKMENCCSLFNVRLASPDTI